MNGRRNVTGGLWLLAMGLAGGLLMSLYAFTPLVDVPRGFVEYDDLPRRLLRLAHIAAVMLPLINIVLGPWLGRLRLSRPARELTSWLLLLGAAGLPAALVLEALLPPLRPLHPTALPAIGFSLGIWLTALGASHTHPGQEDTP